MVRTTWRSASLIIAISSLCIAFLIGCGNKKPAKHSQPTADKAVNLTSDSISEDQNPAFSPDGQSILFSSKRNVNGENLNIWKMGIGEELTAALTSEQEADSVNMPGSSWNGSSDRICFSSDRTGNDNIWMMNPDGGDLVELTKNPAKDWEPTFSPDGRKVAFESDRSGNLDIWIIDLK